MRHVATIVSVLIALSLVLAPISVYAASEGSASPLVLPPNSVGFGKTYGEWSAEWWKWALTLPAEDNHPLIADGEMDCSLGQEGKVWFLGGTFAASPDPENPTVILGKADRECQVPTGKALFFPVVNIICSEMTGDGSTEEELSGCANFVVDTFVNPLSATIDGVGIANLEAYRTVSPLFAADPLPDPNLLGASPGAGGPAVTSGYYLLLHPLSEGEHTIEFEGEIVVPDVFNFRLEISYELTVVGPGQAKVASISTLSTANHDNTLFLPALAR